MGSDLSTSFTNSETEDINFPPSFTFTEDHKRLFYSLCLSAKLKYPVQNIAHLVSIGKLY